MHRFSYTPRPVLAVDKAILMSFVNGRSWDKIHSLNKHAADVVLYHKIRKPLPYSFGVVVCTEDKKTSCSDTVSLNILYRAENFGVAAFLILVFKGLVL